MSVLDPVGRTIAQLFTEKKYLPGLHEVKLDNAALRLPPGIYFLKLGNTQAVETCKIVVR